MTLDAHLGLQVGTLDLDVSVQAGSGSVLAVLGPNGAGKTTILRTLAGLLPLDRGHVDLDGRRVDDPADGVFVPPEHRGVGFVHQDLLLFPHLSVIDNVAFGPRSKGAGSKGTGSKGTGGDGRGGEGTAGKRRGSAGMGRSASRAAAMVWLERMDLARYARDKPGVLSGGQAQRVALARALAAEPSLLLLDEPLASLDAGTRGAVRRDLRRYLDDFAGVAVVVTHDPLDALTLADRVVVLEHGRATQSGPLADVAARPRTRYVADLMGTNLLRGNASGHTIDLDAASASADAPGSVGREDDALTSDGGRRGGSGGDGAGRSDGSNEGAGDGTGEGAVVSVADAVDGPVFATVAPSAITVHVERPVGSARNCWPGTVTVVELLGERVRLHLAGPVPLVAEITPGSLAELGIQVGDRLWASVKATEVAVYPR